MIEQPREPRIPDVSISTYLSVHLMSEDEKNKGRSKEDTTSLWETKVSTTLKKINDLIDSIGAMDSDNQNNSLIGDVELVTLLTLRDKIGIWEFQQTSLGVIGILGLKKFPVASGLNEVVLSADDDVSFLSLIACIQEVQNNGSNSNPKGWGVRNGNSAVFLLSADGVSLCNDIHKKVTLVNTALTDTDV